MSLIYAMNGNFTQASFFIIYAMLFDGFDGIVARLLNTSSEFGVELDSLSDVISFGVAPSFIIYNLYFKIMPPSSQRSMSASFISIALSRNSPVPSARVGAFAPPKIIGAT
mgnify:CR=1 FL=1